MKIAGINAIQYNNSLRRNTDTKVKYSNTPDIPQDSFVKSVTFGNGGAKAIKHATVSVEELLQNPDIKIDELTKKLIKFFDEKIVLPHDKNKISSRTKIYHKKDKDEILLDRKLGRYSWTEDHCDYITKDEAKYIIPLNDDSIDALYRKNNSYPLYSYYLDKPFQGLIFEDGRFEIFGKKYYGYINNGINDGRPFRLTFYDNNDDRLGSTLNFEYWKDSKDLSVKSANIHEDKKLKSYSYDYQGKGVVCTDKNTYLIGDDDCVIYSLKNDNGEIEYRLVPKADLFDLYEEGKLSATPEFRIKDGIATLQKNKQIYMKVDANTGKILGVPNSNCDINLKDVKKYINKLKNAPTQFDNAVNKTKNDIERIIRSYLNNDKLVDFWLNLPIK